VFAGGGNELGRLMRWFAIVGGCYGLLAPKSATVVFIVSLFYLDFVKRLLVLWSGTSINDVMVSLGAGPVMIAAICVACTGSIIIKKYKFGGLFDWLFYLACVLVSVVGFFTIDAEFMERGKSMMGSALLGMTALACYCIYSNKDDSRKLLKLLVWGALPMAVYTGWQYFTGIAVWEEEYILTGLSPTLFNFYVIDGGIEYMRPFSTLNLHPSVGAVSGALFLVSLLVVSKSAGVSVGAGRKVVYFCIGAVFLASMLFAQNRTTFFVPVFFVIFTWSFQRPWRTKLAYFLGVMAFVAIVFNSEYIYDNINILSMEMTATSMGEKFGSLGSYQARLTGFKNLLVIENWQPLGFDEGFEPMSHDPITTLLYRFGYIPLALTLIVSGTVVKWWHTTLFHLEDTQDRAYYTGLTAIIAALLLAGLLYGNLLFVSPVNALFGALIGVTCGGMRNSNAKTLKVREVDSLKNKQDSYQRGNNGRK